MDLAGSTMRWVLAATVALWSPLWCCCVFGHGGEAVADGGAACHAPVEPPACSSCEGEGRGEAAPGEGDEGDSERSCECDQAGRPVATADQPVVSMATPVELMPAFVLAVYGYAAPMGGVNGVCFADHGGPPPGLHGSLLSLSCQLII